MEAKAILRELTYAEGLPGEALKAASAQRAEMLPLFLQEIETYLALEPAARAKPTPLFFIFHLLGEWREKAGYTPLARLLTDSLALRLMRYLATGLPPRATASWRRCSTLSRSTTSSWTRTPKNSFERACAKLSPW